MNATETNHPARYELVPYRYWKRKDGFSGCPARVSIGGALPQPREAYEMAESGFSILDNVRNTRSNYFFGKVGIQTREEGLAIIAKLETR